MKKIAAILILSGVIGFVFISFSWHKPTIGAAAPKRVKDIWTIATPSRIATLDPQQAVSAYEKAVITILFSRLVNLDENVQVAGELAETWDYDMVSSTYSFHLRRNVLFSNGKPLNAQDVVFSFHQWADPKSLDSDLLKDIAGMEEYLSGKSKTIKGVSASDEFTVNIQMARWSDSFIQALALNRFVVLPLGYNGLDKVAFFKNPIGSGPYILESHSPDSVIYKFNSKYFRGQPATDKIQVKYLQQADAVEAFKERKIYDLLMYDFAYTGDLNDNDLVVKNSGNFSTMALYFVETDPRMADKSLRKELLSSLNIERIIKECFPGSSPASSLIPPGMMGSGAGIVSDFKGENKQSELRGKVKILLPNDLNNQCFMKILAEQLAPTHFVLEAVDWQEMYEIFKSGKMSVGIENFVFKTEDPISVLQYFRETSNEYLLGKKIGSLAGLFSKLNDNLTAIDKARVYRSIDSLLINEYHVVPLLHASRYTVFRKSLKNIKFAGSRVNMFNWHEILIEEP